MRHVHMHEVKGEIEFAEKAAAHFAANPKHWSYSLAEIAPGCLVALRWGLCDDCVLVLKLNEFVTVRMPSGNQHSVVLLRDGTVFDPLSDHAGRLADYPEVNNVVAMFKLCRRLGEAGAAQ